MSGESGPTHASTKITRPYTDAAPPWVAPEAAGSDREGFPEWLGSYRRARRLGRGGMGVVYQYRDTKLDRLVAVKRMPHEYVEDPEWRERFDAEAKVLASLDHTNIAKIYHAHEEGNVDYLILEFVAGETLVGRLEGGRLPFEQAMHVCGQVADAIVAGHARGIVHRDVKPGNIMITPADVAKLLDYGLAWHSATSSDASTMIEPARDGQARPADRGDSAPGHMSPRQAGDVAKFLGVAPGGAAEDLDASEDPTSEDARETAISQPRLGGARGDGDASGKRVIVGTPGYMSPEQARGERIDHRTDVWAFGCVLFECLTGRHAFPGKTHDECIESTMRSEPNYDALPEGIPARVRELIETCLRKDPDQRNIEMSAICRDLRAAPVRASTARVRASIPRSLPTQLTSFVCRVGEMDTLQHLLETTRLLTISGPGGSGKTRLAIELGNEVHAADAEREQGPRYPDGVWFVSLAALTDAEQVPQAVATVILGEEGLAQRTGQSESQALIDALAGRRLLLTLDNCEHMADGCNLFLHDLLAKCPHVSVIATSREALGVPGEQSYRVPELSVPSGRRGTDLMQYESVRLFVERVVLARPNFKITEKNANAVADICRHLDGMPLAIELAAARVRSVPVEAVARRLFQVLDPSAVLESSIAWSVDQLLPPERTLLARATMFRSGWSLEAVEFVCGDGDDATIAGELVIDLLSALVDKSLVRYVEQDDHARYHLLETVREYCGRKVVEPTTLAPVRERHLQFFLALAKEADEQFREVGQPEWINRLETEHDNLRAALEISNGEDVDPTHGAEIAKAMHIFWYVGGHLEEGRHALEHALERRKGVNDVLQAQMNNAAGIIAERQGDLAAAKAFYERGLAIVRELGDDTRAAGILTNLGMIAQDSGDLEESREFHRQAMEGYRSIGDEDGVARVQLNLGDVEILDGCYEEARELHEASLPVFKRLGDVQRIGGTLHNLGLIAFHQGREDDAVRLFREGIAARRELLDRPVIANSLLWLGIVLARRDRSARTATLFAAAESLLEGIHTTVVSYDPALYDESLEQVREALGPERFDEAWSRGKAEALDDVIAFALGEDSG